MDTTFIFNFIMNTKTKPYTEDFNSNEFEVDNSGAYKEGRVSGSADSIKQDQHRTGSSFGAYFNVVCVVAGTGTLGLPYAINTGGWITILLFFIAAILAMYTGKLLVECLYYKE